MHKSQDLINITENVRKALDDEIIACVVFVNLKSFWYCRPPDTVSKTESLLLSQSFK